MSGGHGSAKRSDILLQASIVVVLVVGVALLHRYAPAPIEGFDPSPLLAMGFVVLASFTIGALFEAVGLPHITGYLLAGMFFGPSMAEIVGHWWQGYFGSPIPAPYATGILDPAVVEELSLFDDLAVALIAISAGGELKLEELKKGLRLILMLVGGQAVAIALMVGGFVLAIGGSIPDIAMPGFGDLTLSQSAALAACAGAISLATSPAATLAVIFDTRSKGEMTSAVLGTVVFKDVAVVILFAFASAWASAELLPGGTDGSLAIKLGVEIFGSIAVGAVVGVVMALYLRFVGRELLIFIPGMIYLATLVAGTAHLNTVLLFLMAGFLIANLPGHGAQLFHSVEQLSLPVFVLFFTLAGAKLHLEELQALWAFAVGLCLMRVAAIWLGVRVATWPTLKNSGEGLRKYGFLGFASQAGVAISLSAIVGSSLGEPGEALGTLLIAGVAINEIFGPILLKRGLVLAGEAGQQDQKATAREVSLAPRAHGDPTITDEGGTPAHDDPEDAMSATGLASWKGDAAKRDLWGAPCRSATSQIDKRVAELEGDLQALVREVTRGPLTSFKGDAELFIRELRREFLRHHRRISVHGRGTDGEELRALLRVEQAQLAEKWRAVVLARGVKTQSQPGVVPLLVDAVDEIVLSLPEHLEASYEPLSFSPQQDDGLVRGARRLALRGRRAIRRAFNTPMPSRDVAVREIASHRLMARAPERVEGLTALLVLADRHLMARARSIFDGIVLGYDDLAERITEEAELGDALAKLRQQVEQELTLALEEVRRITRDGTKRAARGLGAALKEIKRDVLVYGTLDDTERRGRSATDRRKSRAMAQLEQKLRGLGRASAGGYALLAMELELVGFESRVKEAVEEHVQRLENEVKGRGHVQSERVRTALDEARETIDTALDGDAPGAELAETLREAAKAAEKVAGEGGRIAGELRDELVREHKIKPLLDALADTAVGLTSRYKVVSGQFPLGEYQLPAEVPEPIEVPFRELVTQYIETDVAPKLLASARDIADRVSPMGVAFGELERLLAFNVELATAELEVLPDEPPPQATQELLKEMITGQLERSANVVGGYVDSSRHWPRDLGRGMRDSVLGALEDLRGELVDGEISQASVRAKRRAAQRGRIQRFAQNLPRLAAQAREQGVRAVYAIVGERRIKAAWRKLGFPESTREEPLTAADFAAPEATVDLPLVYERLFAADTMEAVEVMAGREGDLDRAVKALSRVEPGRLRAVALVGADGVGKASLSSAITRARRWKSTKRMTFDGPVTVRDVDLAFKEVADTQLVLVDGLFWLLSAQPGGFAPLRRFVDNVIADGGQRGFVVHADDVFWRYAGGIAPLDDAFPTRIALAPLSADDLRASVMARHNLSGYGHAFERALADGPFEMLLARGASRIRRPFDQYFRDLHEATGGLVRDALRLWLASIKDVESGDLVRVGPVPPSPFLAVAELPEKTLHGVFQVARQGWMDASTYAYLMRMDEVSARAALTGLAELGLLSESQGAFRIAPHLRGAVARTFAQRGWVS